MRALIFGVGAVVFAGILALGIRKFIETTAVVTDDDEEGDSK